MKKINLKWRWDYVLKRAKSYGLRKTDLVEKIDMRYSTLSTLIINDRSPRVEDGIALAHCLYTTAEELCGLPRNDLTEKYYRFLRILEELPTDKLDDFYKVMYGMKQSFLYRYEEEFVE